MKKKKIIWYIGLYEISIDTTNKPLISAIDYWSSNYRASRIWLNYANAMYTVYTAI